jgi:hypothetical protein
MCGWMTRLGNSESEFHPAAHFVEFAHMMEIPLIINLKQSHQLTDGNPGERPRSWASREERRFDLIRPTGERRNKSNIIQSVQGVV